MAEKLGGDEGSGAAEQPRLRRAAGPRPGIGIVHLGLGAFFRAHGAIYVAEAMARSGGDWGILGVSLVSPTQRDRLAPQDFAYTAVELGPGYEKPQVIEVVQHVLVAREDPAAVVAAMADPGVRIVTLTVTEKGYCHEPATGRLNLDHPDIVHDRAEPEAPKSAPGVLVAALAARRAAGLAALHRAQLRQSARERPGRARGACSSSPASAIPPSPTGSRRRAPFPRRWSTGSCRRPRTRTSRGSRR